jgi:hypothetical protein
MSLSKLQISTLGCILDVLELQRPEFDELTPEQNQALIECFNSLVKEKGKGGKSKKSKEKSDDALPKPGNSWIAWLKENRDSIKEQNDGKEEGLPALLSKAYNAFKKTPAFNALKKDCDEKMKEYKEKSNASDDDEPKKKKTKKVEKSSEEKKPLNVYMAYCKEHLDDIKNYVSESGKSFNEAKQEMYAKFKETKEFKTLEAKCKADLKIWNEKEKAPKKQSVASESDSDDDVVVAPPKPVVQKPKTKKKEVVSSESESVPVKKADKKDKKADKKVKDKKNVPSEDEDEPVKKKKADKKADKKAKKVEEMPEPKVEKKKDKKKEVVVEEPPVEDEHEYDPPVEDEPEDDHPAEDEYPAEDE